MNCPKCGSNQAFVVDSRPADGSVKRRRECLFCGQRFNTVEIAAVEYKTLEGKAKMLKRLLDKLKERNISLV